MLNRGNKRGIKASVYKCQTSVQTHSPWRTCKNRSGFLMHKCVARSVGGLSSVVNELNDSRKS